MQRFASQGHGLENKSMQENKDALKAKFSPRWVKSRLVVRSETIWGSPVASWLSLHSRSRERIDLLLVTYSKSTCSGDLPASRFQLYQSTCGPVSCSLLLRNRTGSQLPTTPPDGAPGFQTQPSPQPCPMTAATLCSRWRRGCGEGQGQRCTLQFSVVEQCG